MPLARLTTGTRGPMNGRASPSTARRPCDGTPSTSTSAPTQASSSDAVACSATAARRRAGTSGSRARRGSARRAPARRAHNVVATFPAAIAATAVPHDPAPTHGDAGHAGLRCAFARLGLAPPPPVFARRRSLRIDRACPRDAVGDRVHDAQRRVAHALVCADRHRFADDRDLGDAPREMRACGPSSSAGAFPTSPTGMIGYRRTPARAARFPTCRASARGPRRSCLRGTPRRIHPGRSAATAADSAPAESAVPRYTGIWCAARSSAPSAGILEQFGFGQEPDAPLPRGRPPTRASAGRDTRRDCSRGWSGPCVGDVRRALDRPAQSVAQPGPEHRLRGGIHRVHGR